MGLSYKVGRRSECSLADGGGLTVKEKKGGGGIGLTRVEWKLSIKWWIDVRR